MSAAGQDTTESSIKIRSWEAILSDFLDRTGLRRNQEMEFQHSFGGIDAGKASKEAEAFYREWAKSIGSENAIKTLAKYYDVKYNDTPRYELLKTYVRSVKTGKLSPMAHFVTYEEYHNRIQGELVGKQTPNGITITGQAKHFLERVFGTMIDPEKYRVEHVIIRRSGVPIDDIIRTVLFSEKIDNSRGGGSVKLIGKNCIVTVNPKTGNLIQTNPR